MFNIIYKEGRVIPPFFVIKICGLNLFHLSLYQQIKRTMFQVKENQYIPHKGKSLASGMPACATYYYVTNEQGKVISRRTMKVYRGKQMNEYAFHSREGAEDFVERLTKIEKKIKEFAH